jgi:hypothetical protein
MLMPKGKTGEELRIPLPQRTTAVYRRAPSVCLSLSHGPAHACESLPDPASALPAPCPSVELVRTSHSLAVVARPGACGRMVGCPCPLS